MLRDREPLVNSLRDDLRREGLFKQEIILSGVMTEVE